MLPGCFKTVCFRPLSSQTTPDASQDPPKMEHPQKGRPNPAEPHRPRHGPPPPHTLACPTAPRASGPSLLTAATVPATPPTHTPPAGLPPAANRKPVARRTAHLNSPIGRPPISPSLYGERGCALLTLLADARRSRAPPSSLRRAHLERGKSQPSPRPQRGGFPGGGSGREGRGAGAGAAAPPPGALPAGRAGSWSGKFQAGGRVSPAVASPALPHGPVSTAPRPSPGSSGKGRLPTPHSSARPCCRGGGAEGLGSPSPSSPGSAWYRCLAVRREEGSGDFVLRAPAWPRRAGRHRRGEGGEAAPSRGIAVSPRAAAGSCEAPSPHCSGGRATRGAARPSPLPPPPPPPVPLPSLPRSLLPSSPGGV